MQSRNLSILSQQTASYTTTNAWVNVPQFIITVPEDGNYDIKARYNSAVDNTNRGHSVRFAINGNPVAGITYNYNVDANNYTSGSLAVDDVPLKASDAVSMQAIYDTAATTLYYSSKGVGTFQITKAGV